MWVKLMSQKGANSHTNVVWPHNNSQHTLPKTKMQKPQGKEPSGDPRKRRKAMVFYFYFLHIRKYSSPFVETKVNF